MNYIPYTYLIGWSCLDKWYYGVEYGLKKKPSAHPNNLWLNYFTSSHIVQYYRTNYGEPDIIQIRKIFNSGSFQTRMENAISWEKKVLNRINITRDIWLNGRIGGDICPATNSKIAQIRYGVDNVFQSKEIQEKIKQTNLQRYGVEHPSYSRDLLEKRKNNNINKYGMSHQLLLPSIHKRAIINAQSKQAQKKRNSTNMKRYGSKIVSQNKEVKQHMLNSRKVLSERSIVKIIREYKRIFHIKLKSGWYQQADSYLEELLHNIQTQYGIYNYISLIKILPAKKYSTSIKVLQERQVVKSIVEYKNKYKIKLGRNWYRKSDEYIKSLLYDLECQYGLL